MRVCYPLSQIFRLWVSSRLCVVFLTVSQHGKQAFATILSRRHPKHLQLSKRIVDVDVISKLFRVTFDR